MKMLGETGTVQIGTDWPETICGLSHSETAALFMRACQVFMAKKDQRSFDAVYQV
jgi:hypothetical protein